MGKQDRLEDIVVTISHPHGEVEIALEEWIRTGPGERDGLQPIGARNRSGERIPLSRIPLACRNNTLSKALIKLGIVKNPWRKSGNAH
jgi:hypothetical protein